jgi:hypothetical protein
MGKISVRYGYGFSEHKLHLLQGEFSKATVSTKFSVHMYCTYGFRSHTLKVKNALASSITTKFSLCHCIHMYNNKLIKKLAEFQKKLRFE